MGYKQNFKSPSMLKMLGDLNKDGKMSAYETKRQNAIEKSMNKQEQPAAPKQTARPADPSEMTDAQLKEMVKEMTQAIADGAPSVATTLKPSGYEKYMTKKEGKKVAKKAVKDSLQKLAPKPVAKQTKKKPSVNKGERSKKMGVTTVAERQAQRDAVRKAERKSRPSSPRKMAQPKSKNSGQKKTLDGNVIKYEKNSPASQTKNPSSGFDGYTKIASSKNSNVIAAKKAAASRKNPKSTYKFTKDKKTGETHLYQKG